MRSHIYQEIFTAFDQHLTLPLKSANSIPTICVSDVSYCASKILLNPQPHIEKVYLLNGPSLTGFDFTDDLTIAYGQQVIFSSVAVDQFVEILQNQPHNYSAFEASSLAEMLDKTYGEFSFTVQLSDDFEEICNGQKPKTFMRTLQSQLKDKFKGPTETVSCACKKTKIRTISLPDFVFVSHHGIDRRIFGSERVDFALFDSSNVNFETPLDNLIKINFQDQRKCYLCEFCFTKVLIEFQNDTFPPDSILVPIALFDDSRNLAKKEFQPVFHIHYEQRARNLLDSLPKYVNLPKNFGGDSKTMNENATLRQTTAFDFTSLPTKRESVLPQPEEKPNPIPISAPNMTTTPITPTPQTISTQPTSTPHTTPSPSTTPTPMVSSSIPPVQNGTTKTEDTEEVGITTIKKVELKTEAAQDETNQNSKQTRKSPSSNPESVAEEESIKSKTLSNEVKEEEHAKPIQNTISKTTSKEVKEANEEEENVKPIKRTTSKVTPKLKEEGEEMKPIKIQSKQENRQVILNQLLKRNRSKVKLSQMK